jgi:ACS family glucarate transporter-like MFS transporter
MTDRRRVTGLLILLFAITYIDRVCISVAGPRMQEDLGIDPVSWGWVTAMFTLSYCVFEIPTGALGDRIGPRRVLTRIVLWWSAFTSLTGAVSNYYLLLFIRFCFGAGEAGAFPNASIVISRWFPASQRASMAGVMLMASQIGGAIAPLLVVPIQARYGWRAAFFVFGAAGVSWAAVWYAWFRDTPAEKQSERASRATGAVPVAGMMPAAVTPAVMTPAVMTPAVVTPDASGAIEVRAVEIGGALEIRAATASTATPDAAPLQPATIGTGTQTAHHHFPWHLAFRSETVLALLVMAFCYIYVYTFFQTWFHTFLIKGRGFTEGSLLLSALPYALAACMNLAGGAASDALVRRFGSKWGRRTIGIIGLGAACAFTIAAMLTTDQMLTVILLSLVYGAITFQQSGVFGVCLDIGGSHAGSIVGLMNTSAQVGGFVSSLAYGYIVARFHSFDAPFVPMAAVLFIGMLCWLRIDSSKEVSAEVGAVPAGSIA